MYKFFRHILFAVMIGSTGCITEYEPKDFDQVENYIVVEGYISSGETIIRMGLSKTIYGDLSEELYFSKIRLWVEGDNGYVSANSVLLGRGKFSIETGELDPSASYRLCFDYDDHRYESSFERMLQSGTVSNPRLTKAGRGENVHLIVDSEGENDGDEFWNWRIEERWEVKAELFANARESGSGSGWIYYYNLATSNNIYYCWGNYDNRLMRLTDASAFSENRLVDHSIFNFEPSDDRISILYWARVYQYRITREAYTYFKNMEDNSESGGIFSPIPSQMEGNVKCVTDPSRTVIGWIVASEPATTEDYFWLDEDLYEPPVLNCPSSRTREPGYILYYHSWDEGQFKPGEPKIRYTRPDCMDCRLKPHASKNKPEWWPTDNL